MSLVDTDAVLRREADDLLARGLLSALEAYGSTEVVGSYALGLMVWRDLDIEVVRAAPDRPAFFRLGGHLAEVLRPVRMSYRDHTATPSPGLPRGMYWGVHLGHELGVAWKIDIWAVDGVHQQSMREKREALLDQLTPTTKAAILRIKSAMWARPGYRRTFSAKDIYEAVLDDGVTDVDGFRERMIRREVAI